MQSAAQGYLVYTLTGSAAYLGIIGFASGLPSWLLIMYGGVVADRVSRRSLIIITQTVMMVLAFILAALVFLQIVQPWHILLLSFLLGIANAFDAPARQSFIVELVSRENLTNAIALNATMFNMGAIVGPAIAGFIYALTGPGWCFTINGITFIAVITALTMMNIQKTPVQPRQNTAWQAIVEGLKYIKSERVVFTLILTIFVINIFGFGLITLIPAWAVTILRGDAATNGLLLSARGVGAVISGLLIASLSGDRFRSKMWNINSFIVPVSLIGFALSTTLPISMIFLGLVGFALIAVLNNSNAMIQGRVPDALRGRVMAVYSLMLLGGGPVGALLVGLMADHTSEQFTALVCAGILLAFSVWIWLFHSEIRKMG